MKNLIEFDNDFAEEPGKTGLEQQFMEQLDLEHVYLRSMENGVQDKTLK